MATANFVTVAVNTSYDVLRCRGGSAGARSGDCLCVRVLCCRRTTCSPRMMTAAPRFPLAQLPAQSTALESLMHYASGLVENGRSEEGEMVLREAMTIAPESPAPYHALLSLILRSGRDVDAFTFCAAMLARLTPPSAATLRVAAETMLTLHRRHAHLLRDAAAPSRIILSAEGVLDPTPMVMAPEYLRRARSLARSATLRNGRDGESQLTLAECELVAGNASLARRVAERSVPLLPPTLRGAAIATHAFSAFADHAEALALALLQSPHVTELAPSLGSGRFITALIDPSLAPSAAPTDPNRITTRIPIRVELNRTVRERTIAVRVSPPELRTLRGGRVVGGEWIVLGDDNRAWVHGVREHALPIVLGTQLTATFADGDRNRILWANDERLLLHAPRAEREHSGRAVLLATSAHDDSSRWMLEAIGRLSAMPDLLLEPDVRFVVPATLLPLHRELLAWLGIGDDRLTTVADDEIVSFDELILVRHRTHGGCVDARVVEWLRDKLTIPQIVTSAPPTRRIFIRSATRSGTRYLLNEPELERVCQSLGFECVDGDALSLAGWRDLLTDAACVVAAEQPSLANLLFAPRGAEAVILAPRSFARPRHAALAHALGIGTTFVLGAERPTRAVYPNWEFAVDANELRIALTRILG